MDVGVEPLWLVAGCELGCGETMALWVEQAHGVLWEVAAVGCLPFVVQVGQDGADQSDGTTLAAV